MNKDQFYLKNTETGEYLLCKVDALTKVIMFGFGEKATKFSKEDIKELPFFIRKDIEKGIIVKEINSDDNEN